MKTWKEPVVTVQTYVPESSVSTELITNTPKPSSLVEYLGANNLGLSHFALPGGKSPFCLAHPYVIGSWKRITYILVSWMDRTPGAA